MLAESEPFEESCGDQAPASSFRGPLAREGSKVAHSEEDAVDAARARPLIDPNPFSKG